jgi:hypothetical protein
MTGNASSMNSRPAAKDNPCGIPALHRVIASGIIVAAFFGLCENAARIYEARPRDPFSLHDQFAGDADHGNFLMVHTKFIRDPDLFWRIRPHFGPTSYNNITATLYAETTNSRGFRGTAEFGRKREGTYRVIALGDSWTYGVVVNDHETYPAQLERLLNEKGSGPRGEVLNLG